MPCPRAYCAVTDAGRPVCPGVQRYTRDMSWLSRLFSAAPPPAAPAAPPPAHSVVIPDDIIDQLGAADDQLQSSVEDALRSLIEIRRRAAEHDAEGLPFWLRREAGQQAEIDESLRDRVSQRRAAENG